MSVLFYGIGSPVILDVAETCRRLKVPVSAWVRNVEGAVFTPEGTTIIEPESLSGDLLAGQFAVALFTPGYRHSAVLEARGRGLRNGATLVDPTALVASSAQIGLGAYVNSMANIAAACRIGEFVFINRNASIGHHADMAPFASVGPGAVIAGNVTIGHGALIGAGAIVVPRMQIGANAVVTAGAVVTKNVPANTVVAGNPARVVKRDIAGYHGVSVPWPP